MTDEQETPVVEEAPVVETPPAETPPAGEAPKEEEPKTPEDDEDKDLDEKTKKRITKLNHENAGWRTQVRDLQAKLEAAKTPEDFEAARNESATKISKLERELVLAHHPLPEALAARLTGNSYEELLADAKALSQFVTTQSSDDDDLSGGLTPSGDAPSYDPVKRAKEVRNRRGPQLSR